jgi:CrcB protein
MTGYLLVFIGGGAGALSRHLSIQFWNALIPAQFAFGTLFVNCAGSLCAGFLSSVLGAALPDATARLLVMTGFLGGYTTFSTYALETARYFLNGDMKRAAVNILCNNVLTLLCVVFGMMLHRALMAK